MKKKVKISRKNSVSLRALTRPRRLPPLAHVQKERRTRIRSCQLLDASCCLWGCHCPLQRRRAEAGNYFTVETIFMKLVFLCHFGIWIRFWHCHWYWACLWLRFLSPALSFSLSLFVCRIISFATWHKTVARRDKMNSDKLPNSS